MLQRAKFGVLSSILIFILTLPLLSVTSGCAASEAHKGLENTVQAIKSASTSSERIYIGVVEWIAWTPFLVAEEKGFFEDEGLDAKVVVFTSPSDRRSAFLAGNIQFSSGSYIAEVANGHPSTIILMVGIDDSGVIVIKDKFKDLGELEGRRVACAKETVDLFFLEKALERYGLTVNDVTVIDMTPQEEIIAFFRGTVDAAVGSGIPIDPELPKMGGGKVAMTSEDIPGILLDCFSVQNEILEHNPEVAVKVLKCYLKGLKGGEEHPDEYYEIANKRLFHENPSSKRLLQMMEYFIGQPSLVQQFLVSMAEKQHAVAKIFKPEEIKEQMKEGGPLYQHCQELLDFYYEQGMIDSKPDPASFINGELYLKVLEAYSEQEPL